MRIVKPVNGHRNASRSLKSGIALSLLAAAMTVGSGNAAHASNAGLLARAPSIQAQHLPAVVVSGQALMTNPVAASQRLKLGIALPTRNRAELDLLLHDLQDPQSSRFHQYLTPEEYTERFGPTQADYDMVVAWAQTNGFEVTGTAPNRRLISIEGDVPHVQAWINDQQVLDFTDTANHASGGITEGPIAIQIHGGPDRWVPGGFWRWRVIAVKELP